MTSWCGGMRSLCESLSEGKENVGRDYTLYFPRKHPKTSRDVCQQLEENVSGFQFRVGLMSDFSWCRERKVQRRVWSGLLKLKPLGINKKKRCCADAGWGISSYLALGEPHTAGQDGRRDNIRLLNEPEGARGERVYYLWRWEWQGSGRRWRRCSRPHTEEQDVNGWVWRSCSGR